MRKLNMPPDFFWKYEFWPKERAFSTLQRVINRVFAAIMNENKEGFLDLKDVDVENQRFTISFKDCAECAGVKAPRPFCYYHAGTFAGIISGLMSKEMDGYEITCASSGHEECTFIIGRREDPQIGVHLTDFLAPKKLGIAFENRLRSSLKGENTRPTGNKVNIEYYQLMVANSILNNPALFSATSFTTGIEAGKKLAEILKDIYQQKQLDIVNRYYTQIQHLELQTAQEGSDTVVMLTECAETALAFQKKEFIGYLLGELQGLFSSLLEKPLTCKESWFENNILIVRLSPQV
jgi:predicted hydrocarbon binding protein